jgi:hypothetical protein
MNWETLPNSLKVSNSKDFCMRCEDIYDTFWERFAPFFDISIYRDYLLEQVEFSKKASRQLKMAGVAWEFLMGDLTRGELFEFWLYPNKKEKE